MIQYRYNADRQKSKGKGKGSVEASGTAAGASTAGKTVIGPDVGPTKVRHQEDHQLYSSTLAAWWAANPFYLART
jgi:hypothetical protein